MDLAKNLSEVMMASLPNFWKLSSGFTEGKFKKVMWGSCLSPVFMYSKFHLRFKPQPELDGVPRNADHGFGYHQVIYFFNF